MYSIKTKIKGLVENQSSLVRLTKVLIVLYFHTFCNIPVAT